MLKDIPVTHGCDPEIFLQLGGRVVGSERVIPYNGLGSPFRPAIVRDGIQVELHPIACYSIKGLADNLSRCFLDLNFHMKKFPDASINWETLVEVGEVELSTLSEASRILGCKPSKNFYGPKPINVPDGYRKRSASGHMHFGLSTTQIFQDGEWARLVPLLDIFVGNTLVLVDRDPNAAQRREYYGRAGEFRLPKYGLEYRTPSNVWLKNYSIMNLAFGMAKIATSVLEQTLKGEPLENELIDVVDIGKVVQAIDTNNWELARANFEDIRPFLEKHLPQGLLSPYPLTPKCIQKFVDFTEGVRDNGLGHYFKIDPLTHWITRGFVDMEMFLERNVY
jgi:hypothetical protein